MLASLDVVWIVLCKLFDWLFDNGKSQFLRHVILCTEVCQSGFERGTVVLISPWPDQEGNNLMFLSEWREFPSSLCLAGKKKFYDSSRLDVAEIARVADMLPSLFHSWSG